MRKFLLILIATALITSCNVIETFDGDSKIDQAFFERPDGGYMTELQPSTYNVNFGNVLTNSSHLVTVSLENQGSSTISALSSSSPGAPYVYSGGAFPGTGGTCTSSLNPGAICLIEFAYSPVTDSNVIYDSVSISYFNGEFTQSFSLNIEGSSYSFAQLDFIDAPSYVYADTQQGFFLPKSFIIQNNGNGVATNITGIVSTNTNFKFSASVGYPGNGGDCSTTLAPGASCTLVVDFIPQAVGTYTDTIYLNYDDSTGSLSSFLNLSGTGI